jgi:hypothetical protein
LIGAAVASACSTDSNPNATKLGKIPRRIKSPLTVAL